MTACASLRPVVAGLPGCLLADDTDLECPAAASRLRMRYLLDVCVQPCPELATAIGNYFPCAAPMPPRPSQPGRRPMRATAASHKLRVASTGSSSRFGPVGNNISEILARLRNRPREYVSTSINSWERAGGVRKDRSPSHVFCARHCAGPGPPGASSRQGPRHEAP